MIIYLDNSIGKNMRLWIKALFVFCVCLYCETSTTFGATTISAVSLQVKIEPASGTMDARAVLAFATDCREDVAFYLNPKSTVSRMIVDTATPIVCEAMNGKITLQGIEPGSHTVTIWYRGYFPDASRRETGVVIRNDLVSLHDFIFWHPTIPFQTFAFSLCLDIPAHLHAVSCGRLLTRRVENGREITQWEADRIRSGGTIVAADFQQVSGFFDGIPVSISWTNPRFFRSKELLTQAGSLITCFQRAYGPWPYAGLHLIEDPNMARANGRGLNGLILLATDAIDLAFYDGLVCASGFLAHEVGHNYWAGLLSGHPEDWFSFMLLTEGMAHFSALSYLSQVSKDGFNHFLMKRLVSDWERNHPPPVAFHKFDINFPKMPIIAKCGIFVWSLRREVGSDEFDRRLRAFIANHRWCLISADSFLDAVARPSGSDIEAFLTRWFDSTDLLPFGDTLPTL